MVATLLSGALSVGQEAADPIDYPDGLLAEAEAEAAAGESKQATSESADAQAKYQAMLQDLEQYKKALSQQHVQAEQEYRRAIANYQQAIQQQQPQVVQQRVMLEAQMQQLEATRAQLAQQMAQLHEAEQVARRQRERPVPESGTTKIFSLKHSQAGDSARLLSEVLAGQPMRLAVDDRTNSLILFADEDTAKVAEALLLRLDQSTGDPKVERSGETLQLRIVWLLDINEDREPADKLVSPEVVEALHELGFADPQVVCQQVTTLTLSEDGGRRGHFNFAVPVLIESQPWQFEGKGQIEPMADDRFNLRFDLRFQQRSIQPDGQVGYIGQEGQLGGSIYTPLSHYTVMGTTTFVAVKRDGDSPTQEQHLSAFVVYLDRAPEYPASDAPSKDRTGVRR
jgi:hypothetical protein